MTSLLFFPSITNRYDLCYLLKFITFIYRIVFPTAQFLKSQSYMKIILPLPSLTLASSAFHLPEVFQVFSLSTVTPQQVPSNNLQRGISSFLPFTITFIWQKRRSNHGFNPLSWIGNLKRCLKSKMLYNDKVFPFNHLFNNHCLVACVLG